MHTGRSWSFVAHWHVPSKHRQTETSVMLFEQDIMYKTLCYTWFPNQHPHIVLNFTNLWHYCCLASEWSREDNGTDIYRDHRFPLFMKIHFNFWRFATETKLSFSTVIHFVEPLLDMWGLHRPIWLVLVWYTDQDFSYEKLQQITRTVIYSIELFPCRFSRWLSTWYFSVVTFPETYSRAHFYNFVFISEQLFVKRSASEISLTVRNTKN